MYVSGCDVYAGHVRYSIVGNGSDVVVAFCLMIIPEPDVILNVVEPLVVERTPPYKRPG